MEKIRKKACWGELPTPKKGVLELAIFGNFFPEIKGPYIYHFPKFQLYRIFFRVKPYLASIIGAPPTYYGASGLMGVPLAGCSTYGLVRRLWPGPYRSASSLDHIRAPSAWTT